MITPRLFRRSLARGLQWRLLFLWWASLLVPGAIAALPVFRFFSAHLDHSTRAREVVAFLDGATLLDLLRKLSDDGAGQSMALGLVSGALALLLVAPFMSGALVAAARSDEPLSLPQLLAGAGELYARLLRTFLCGLVPLGLGAGLAAGAVKIATSAAERDVSETTADAHLLAGIIAGAVALFLFQLLLDAARAQFAADPARRSAAAALWSALRLIVRRPLRALGVGALGTLVGLGGAAAFMVLRLRLEQASVARIALAWGLAQAAHLTVGWGRAARIFGLADLARADDAARSRSERTEPPPARPPLPLVQSETLPALGQPPPLSPKDASGT